MDLWHYTCEHGARAIGRRGSLEPAVSLKPELRIWWPAHYVWLTTQEKPDAAGLGLTRLVSRCDRTEYRYRVLDLGACFLWQFARGRHLDSPLLAELESAYGARPESWWISETPVAVVLD